MNKVHSLFKSEQCAIRYNEIGELLSLYVHGCYILYSRFFQRAKFSWNSQINCHSWKFFLANNIILLMTCENFSPWKVVIGQFVKNFPLENNQLYGCYVNAKCIYSYHVDLQYLYLFCTLIVQSTTKPISVLSLPHNKFAPPMQCGNV